MTVKQVAINNVIDRGHVCGSAQDRERRMLLSHHCLELLLIRRAVEIHRKQLKAFSRPSRVVLTESDPIFPTSPCSGGPEVKQHRLFAPRRQSERRKRVHLTREIGKREIRRLDRRQQPSLSSRGQGLDLLWHSVCGLGVFDPGIRELISPRLIFEGLYSKWLGTFFNPHPAIDRQIVEFLYQSAGPSNRRLHRARRRSQAKEDILAVLRKKSRSSLQRPSLAAQFSSHRDQRANGVTIALRTAQAEGDRWRQVLHDVFQDAQLRPVAVLEEHRSEEHTSELQSLRH